MSAMHIADIKGTGSDAAEALRDLQAQLTKLGSPTGNDGRWVLGRVEYDIQDRYTAVTTIRAMAAAKWVEGLADEWHRVTEGSGE